jgi:acetyl esterase/lipase
MKHAWFLSIFLGFMVPGFAQNKSGITGKTDTSYSTYSAYKSTLKKYPDITIVPEMPSAGVKENRNLVYCTIGSRDLHIDAFIPAIQPKKRKPGVLIIHGGGWRSGNRAQHVPLAQRLAKAGYAAFTVEYRLSTEALYPAGIQDIKTALRWMHANAKKFNVDLNKIAVLGFSAGGQLAALAGATSENPVFEAGECLKNYPSTVNAVIDIDGTLSFTHPESGEGDDSRSTSAATYWFGYAKKDNTPLWDQASPLTYARQTKVPYLFLNSGVARMHAGRDDFQKLLTQNNIYSEVHTFEGSPHSFCLFNPWFEPTVNYIQAFLHKVFNQ